MKLTSDLHLVPRLRVNGCVPLLPMYLHGVDSDNFTSYYIYGGIYVGSLNICGRVVSMMDVLWAYGSAA